MQEDFTRAQLAVLIDALDDRIAQYAYEAWNGPAAGVDQVGARTATELRSYFQLRLAVANRAARDEQMSAAEA